MGVNLKTNKIIELRKQGMTYEQIRKQLNVSHPTIAKVLKENDMLKSTVYTPETVLKIKSMLDSGHHVKDIAKEIGATYVGLRSYMVRNNIRVERKSKNIDLVLSLSDKYDTNQIASKTGLSANYVRTVRYRHGASKSPATYRKEKVLQLWKSGNTIEKIVELTGLKRHTILKYLRVRNISHGIDN